MDPWGPGFKEAGPGSVAKLSLVRDCETVPARVALIIPIFAQPKLSVPVFRADAMKLCSKLTLAREEPVNQVDEVQLFIFGFLGPLLVYPFLAAYLDVFRDLTWTERTYIVGIILCLPMMGIAATVEFIYLLLIKSPGMKFQPDRISLAVLGLLGLYPPLVFGVTWLVRLAWPGAATGWMGEDLAVVAAIVPVILVSLALFPIGAVLTVIEVFSSIWNRRTPRLASMMTVMITGTVLLMFWARAWA